MLTIYSGEDFSFNLDLGLKTPEGLIYDLTGVTEINAKFTKTDGTKLEKKLSTNDISVVQPAAGCTIKISLSDADTNALKVGEGLGLSVYVDKNTERRIADFTKVYSVRKPST